jgi:diguanylate cyclase (GGDEF)-like protein
MDGNRNTSGSEGKASALPLRDIHAVRTLIGQKVELPSPPGIVVRILEAVQNDDQCFANLGRIVAADPALAVKLLKVANSSMYGCNGKVQSIESALTILGISALKNIALTFIIVRTMHSDADGFFDFKYFWKRAVTAAVAARTLAQQVGQDSDTLFVSALLQDIGVLVLFHHCTDTYMEVLVQKNSRARSGHDIEHELLGFCHAGLGGTLLKDWGLPEKIYLPIFYSHRPQSVPDSHRTTLDILNLADRISATYHGSQSSVNMVEVLDVLTLRYNLTEQEAKNLIDSLAGQANEVMDFFDIPNNKIKPFSEMLQEANQELGKLNIGYEQLFMDLKQSKEESSIYVTKLLEANKRYRQLAYRDELTGLYNNRYFQEAMENELDRSKRYQRPLSLIFFDIDLFKEINDRLGHLVGDVALREVAKQVSQVMRTSDIVVRYGGDEFAIIMPETDKAGLEAFAERIRHSIEAMTITVDGVPLQLTISVGGTATSGKQKKVDEIAIIAAADKALYQAKRAGRNGILVVEL